MRASLAIAAICALSGSTCVAGDAATTTPPVSTPPATTAAAAPSPLTAAERAALDELYRRAVAAGLPDATGGTLFFGTLLLSEPEAAKTKPTDPRQRRFARKVKTENGRSITTLDKGLHLRCADGRWLINLHRQLRPDADHVITLGEGTAEVAPAEAMARLQGRSRSSGDDDEDSRSFLAMFLPADRERLTSVTATMRRLSGLDYNFSSSTGLLHLRRLGVPEADVLLLTRSAWLVFPPNLARIQSPSAATPLGLPSEHRYRGDYGQRDFDWAAFRTSHVGTLAIPSPDLFAASLVTRWFRSLLDDADALTVSGLTASQAGAGLIAFTPADAQPAFRPIVERLVARLAIPVTPAGDADLAARLQSWEPSSWHRRNHLPDIDDATLATLPEEVRQQFAEQRAQNAAWQPSDGDIPGLLGLLDDPRPSRWKDDGMPRTLGDSAWYALAVLAGLDPRLLIGRDPAAPWTDAEHAAASAALRAWWRKLDGKPLAEGLAATIGSLPSAAIHLVLTAKPPEERAPLIDAVVAAWSTAPPTGQPPGDIAQVIAAAGDHAGLATLVRSWKPEGALRPLLACWRDRHGDPASLDALVDELAAHPPADDAAASILACALGQTLWHPSLGRLQRSLSLAGLPPDDHRLWALVNALTGASTDDAGWEAVSQLDNDPRQPSKDEEQRGNAIYLAITTVLLADQRPLPTTGVSLAVKDPSWGTLTINGTRFGISAGDDDEDVIQNPKPKPSERPTPTGLRIRDAAALILGGGLRRYGNGDERPPPLPKLDPWAAAEARDRVVQALAERISEPARAALAAAKLPDIIPSASPAAGGDHALF